MSTDYLNKLWWREKAYGVVGRGIRVFPLEREDLNAWSVSECVKTGGLTLTSSKA